MEESIQMPPEKSDSKETLVGSSGLVSAALTPEKDFEAITLEEKKQPKRVLHFSDGILEEFSSDEEDETDDSTPKIDPKTLTWIPYMWYYCVLGATKTLAVCDFVGEKFAWWLGITSPKYQYAIDEYNRLHAEEREELDQEAEEREEIRNRVAETNAKKLYMDPVGQPGTDPSASNI
ncbi:protein FAM177A1-like [Anneissia japonica]|uniref:protein FAM177A1-like n=1 Tax=Anneissia japonica TaxID=1529436 RepID=UPI001425580E|nr:protein FAM177A1-like [Anneissia japonica]